MNETRESSVGPGMDHEHYAYSPAPTRPPLTWPGNAGCAVVVLLYLEHWELFPPKEAVLDQRLARANGGGFFPETRAHSYREYGSRVGGVPAVSYTHLTLPTNDRV